MALKRISDYADAGALNGMEMLELETAAGGSAKCTVQDIANLAGAPPDASLVLVAGVDLNYPRVVAVSGGNAYYPDLTNPADVQRVIGVTKQAAATGASVGIARTGTFTESGWNWSPGPLYCAVSGGTLTQTPPATGAVLEVGKAINPTTINIFIHRAILR